MTHCIASNGRANFWIMYLNELNDLRDLKEKNWSQRQITEKYTYASVLMDVSIQERRAKNIRRNVEGDDRDIIWGIVSAFTWRCWGTPRESSIRIVVVSQRFEPVISRMRIGIVTGLSIGLWYGMKWPWMVTRQGLRRSRLWSTSGEVQAICTEMRKSIKVLNDNGELRIWYEAVETCNVAVGPTQFSKESNMNRRKGAEMKRGYKGLGHSKTNVWEGGKEE
jgi:hypothetical protein